MYGMAIAYIGLTRNKPIVECIYQTDIKDNQFLIDNN